MVKLVILACGVVLVGIILYPLKKDVVFGKRGSIPNQHLMSFEDIDKALNKIPKKDQIQLRHFFNMCIGWDEFGYVLLGDKPMALSGFGHVKNPLRSFRALRYALSPRRIKYVNGYRAWKKYENLFPMTQFILIYEENTHGTDILLINKKKFIQTVDIHQNDFESALKCPTSGEKLLEEVCKMGLSKSDLFDNDLLLGILFGYGRHNAFVFQQRAQMPVEKIEDFDRKHCFGLVWKEEETAEWEEEFKSSVSWTSIYITGAHLNNIELNPLPGFMAVLNCSETEAI